MRGDGADPEEETLFDEPTIRFLHGGCSLLVGSVDPAGRPHAGRAWGITVLDAPGGDLGEEAGDAAGGEPADGAAVHVRLLLDADDTVTLANLSPGAAVAITTAAVPTLTSLQMKGTVVRTEPATAADEVKRRQYTTDFIGDIHETDGDPLDVLERWSDRRVVACVVAVESSFDQTPGPSAGAPIVPARP